MFKERVKKNISFLPNPIGNILIGLYRIPHRNIFIPLKKHISNRKELKKILDQELIRLELGSSEKKEGWVTIDLKRGADLQLDITKSLPFPNESVAEIHSEHFFEHLTIDEIKSCLRDCFRVLKYNGEISFSVPDFKRACRTYLLDADDLHEKRFWLLPFPNWCKSRLDELNFLIYADGFHKFMFDEENGIHRLEEVGFKNCRVREYDFKKDNDHKKYESLYFVGCKIKQ